MPDGIRTISAREAAEWRREIPKKPVNAGSTGDRRDLDSENRFDYSKARPNRFAGRPRVQPVVVVLAPDVAKVFKDGESVNAMLRSIMKALPRNGPVD